MNDPASRWGVCVCSWKTRLTGFFFSPFVTNMNGNTRESVEGHSNFFPESLEGEGVSWERPLSSGLCIWWQAGSKWISLGMLRWFWTHLLQRTLNLSSAGILKLCRSQSLFGALEWGFRLTTRWRPSCGSPPPRRNRGQNRVGLRLLWGAGWSIPGLQTVADGDPPGKTQPLLSLHLWISF